MHNTIETSRMRSFVCILDHEFKKDMYLYRLLLEIVRGI
jgi:hypothetical protein